MFERLDVPVKKSDMSFGVSVKKGKLEYSLNTMNSMFGQRSNLCRVNFYRLLRDIVLFNSAAALVAGGVANDLKAGVEAASASIDSGKAADTLDAFVSFTQNQ